MPDANPKADAPEGSQKGGDDYLQGFKGDEKVDWEGVVRREDVTDWQVKRASWLVRGFAEFRAKLHRSAPLLHVAITRLACRADVRREQRGNPT